MPYRKSSFLRTKTKINRQHHRLCFHPQTGRPNATPCYLTMSDKRIMDLWRHSQEAHTRCFKACSKVHEKTPCVNGSNPFRSILRDRSNTQEICRSRRSKRNASCHKKAIAPFAKAFLKCNGCCTINHIL